LLSIVGRPVLVDRQQKRAFLLLPNVKDKEPAKAGFSPSVCSTDSSGSLSELNKIFNDPKVGTNHVPSCTISVTAN
jgi:hypothetical protein